MPKIQKKREIIPKIQKKRGKKPKPPVIKESHASEDDSSNTESDTEAPGNSGWANSIAKVLKTTKPKTKKTLVLSRAKKTKPVMKSEESDEDYGFEIEGEGEGETKKEKPTEADTSKGDKKKKRLKNIPLNLRVKPTLDKLELEKERALRKVATRGVVQLFNTVRAEQRVLERELKKAGPLDSRREAVLNNINKRKFLDVLMSGKRAKSEIIDDPVLREEKEEQDSDEDSEEDNDVADEKKKKGWSVLRPDFMTNKKIKHWDEEDEEEQNSSNNNASEDSEDDD